MRIWQIVVLAMILGVGMGVGASHVRLGWHFGEGESLPPAGGELQIEQTVYDFGTLDNNSHGEHDFIFTNVGDEPLALEPGGSSCACTVSELKVSTIPPGDSAPVTVTWDTRGKSGNFEHTAMIVTSDPHYRRVELKIKGRVLPSVVPEPHELVLSKAAVERETHGEVTLYWYRGKPPEQVDYEVLDEQTAGFFEVAFEPIPPEDLPDAPKSNGGWLMQVTVKPGLPLGRVRQTVRVKTGLEDPAAIEVPVDVTVSSDVTIVCLKPNVWDDDNNILSLGAVDSESGAEETLLIHFFGDQREETTIQRLQVEPEGLLVAEMGEKQTKANVVVFPLTVKIPAGSPDADYSGSKRAKAGRVTIQTTHPHAREIRVFVRFQVISSPP